MRALLIGMLITALVIVLDGAGKLQRLEWALYDARVRLCQFFRKLPTDRLVHVDIDDSALETIGRWPWPRAILADVVDELGRAGTKAVAFDVLLSEPEKPEWHEDHTVTDHDRIFADAVRKMGHVLVPASLTFEDQTTAIQLVPAAELHLEQNLELSFDELNQLLLASHLPRVTQDEYAHAQKTAMATRVQRALDAEALTSQQLRQRLLPTISRWFPNHPAIAVLDKIELQYRAQRAFERLTLPMTAATAHIPLLHGIGVIAALPEFSAAARFSGIVDNPAMPDGVVRAIPLFAEFHNRLAPQIGLVLACAALDVDPQQLLIQPGQVQVPLADGFNINIPVHELPTRFGRGGLFMDVPWFGGKDWISIYGAPGRQHVNISVLYELAGWRRRLSANNQIIDESLLYLMNQSLDLAPVQEKLAAAVKGMAADDFAARRDYVARTLGNEELKQGVPALPADDKIRIAWDNLVSAANQNERLDALARARSAQFRSMFENHVVLIGNTASANTDMVNTPLAPQMPGVIAHGVVVNAILTRQMWREAPFFVTALYTLGCGLIATLAVAFLGPFRSAMSVIALLLGFLLLNGIVLFDRGNYLLGTAGPVVVIVLVWGVENLISVITETAERARLDNRFRSRTDPQLVDFLHEHPEQTRLSGQRKELTVVFTDLEGFTAASEKLREETVQVLNEYFRRMVPLIRRRKGFVNKLLGDGIMFFFGAPFDNPNHATDAIETVLDMVAETERFSTDLVARGLPPVVMRAGINSGIMTVGDVGGEAYSDYTLIDDNVNTAARLEKANKRFDARVMIGGNTYRHLDSTRFALRPVGALMLAGKSESVQAYEVLARSADATITQRQICRLSEPVVATFAAGDVAGCLEAIERMRVELGQTKFLAAYEQLCRSAEGENASVQKYVFA
ncbi:MAG TPA: adenylate/guanylate cyclase domain-containing protein [Tepidisphaeraceae bacterium]|nr:adenylate/guanylate cyclase domain-containing protein [Tepidisphaeraceae bacterium]